jgi:sugar lactone lactonase YvrE
MLHEPDVLAASVLVADGDLLGEGPSWDPATGTLMRCDITAGRVLRLRPGEPDAAHEVLDFGDVVSFAVPRGAGGFVAGVRHEIVRVAAGGDHTTIAAVETDRDNNRFNDAKCDPVGRLWAGTMSMTREPRSAALYRLDAGAQPVKVLDHLMIANGLDWSADGNLMYFIDSPTQRIDMMDFDLAEGRPADRRTFVEVDPADGLPDGLTVDAEGGVWVALFGGGQVRRYDPDGKLDAVVELPTSNCTCPVFGGPDLDELYVTTARHRLPADQLAAQPLAGAVFRVRPGVRGRPAWTFAG